eukprot:5379376-Pyramimonas_sp.AAC.1
MAKGAFADGLWRAAEVIFTGPPAQEAQTVGGAGARSQACRKDAGHIVQTELRLHAWALPRCTTWAQLGHCSGA